MTVSLLPTHLCSAKDTVQLLGTLLFLVWAVTLEFYQLHLKFYRLQALLELISVLQCCKSNEQNMEWAAGIRTCTAARAAVETVLIVEQKRQQLRLRLSLSERFHHLHHLCWTLMSALTLWRRGRLHRLTAQHALQCIIGSLVWKLWIRYGPLIMDMELSCGLDIILLPNVASGSYLAVVWLNNGWLKPTTELENEWK